MHRRDGSITLFPTEHELETAANYKPVHGGYPDYVKATSPTSPVPGSEWNDTTEFDNIPGTVVIDGIRKSVTGTLDDYQREPKPGIYRMEDRGVTRPDNLPSVYFDAVRLNVALTEIASNAQARQWALQEAMRNVRRGNSNAEQALRDVYNREMSQADNNLKVLLLVNDLANVIDPDKRPEKQTAGYGVTVYPSMERYYAFRPVWEFINNVRKAFKRTDA